jgi:hypothetical protein
MGIAKADLSSIIRGITFKNFMRFKLRLTNICIQTSCYFFQNVWKCYFFVHMHLKKIAQSASTVWPTIIFPKKAKWGIKNSTFYVDSQFVDMGSNKRFEKSYRYNTLEKSVKSEKLKICLVFCFFHYFKLFSRNLESV